MELSSSRKIHVRARVVSFSVTRDRDTELHNLKMQYDSLANQNDSHQLIWFVSHACVCNNEIAFLVFGKETRLKISNQISSLFATYLSFVGGLIETKPNVHVIDEKKNRVPLESLRLEEFIQNPNANWASYQCKMDSLTVRVRVQLLNSAKGLTIEILKSEYNRMRLEVSKYLRFCPNATVNNEDVAILIYDIPTDAENGKHFTDEQSYLFSVYSTLVCKVLTQNKGVYLLSEASRQVKAEQFQLNNFIVSSDVTTWSLYDGKNIK